MHVLMINHNGTCLVSRVKRGNLAHWDNPGQRVKSSVNHKVHTVFLVIVVSMNWLVV